VKSPEVAAITAVAEKQRARMAEIKVVASFMGFMLLLGWEIGLNGVC
jgi:hypothetical protein